LFGHADLLWSVLFPPTGGGGDGGGDTNEVVELGRIAAMSGNSSTVVSTHYTGDAGKEYVKQRQHNPNWPGYGINLESFKPYLNKSQITLDFGCGNGGMLRLLPPLVARADGLEVNPAAREVAQGFGQKVYASLDELPETPTYDLVVTNHVLEHVRDVCATLERVRKCMKPGAKIIVKLPLDDWRASHQRGWGRGDTDYHIQTWTPRLFANVLYECGFEVNESRVLTLAWHPKLFWSIKLGLSPLVFRAFAVVKNRRQLFAVATNPG